MHVWRYTKVAILAIPIWKLCNIFNIRVLTFRVLFYFSYGVCIMFSDSCLCWFSGIPTLTYGIACWMLIKCHEDVVTEQGTVRIYFLNKEQQNAKHWIDYCRAWLLHFLGMASQNYHLSAGVSFAIFVVCLILGILTVALLIKAFGVISSTIHRVSSSFSKNTAPEEKQRKLASKEE